MYFPVDVVEISEKKENKIQECFLKGSLGRRRFCGDGRDEIMKWPRDVFSGCTGEDRVRCQRSGRGRRASPGTPGKTMGAPRAGRQSFGCSPR